MKPSLALFAAAASLIGGAGEAGACRYLRPPPPLPIVEGRYEAVVLADIVSQDAEGANARINAVFDGRPPGGPLRLDWLPAPGPNGDVVITSCDPPRVHVVPGDSVVVVLVRTGDRLHAFAWKTLAVAGGQDDFYPLYLAERDPAARRRLRQRWRLVNRFGGPVPVGDATRWFAPHRGTLGPLAGGAVTNVEFAVDAAGRVQDCRSRLGVTDSRVCAGLQRRRFLAPLLSRERRGWYAVRWDQRPAPR
jgi:hypothetical protein